MTDKLLTHALAPEFVSQPPQMQAPKETPNEDSYLDSEILVLVEQVTQADRICPNDDGQSR
jgi:hypothetical protein